MATGKLGKPAVISYQSKNGTTGLTDIKVTIIRPDLTPVGPFALTEYSPGFYSYSFSTSLLDPEGDYLGIIDSPSESLQTHVKLSLFQPESGGGASVTVGGVDLVGKLLTAPLQGKIVPSPILKGVIQLPTLKGVLPDNTLLKGKIYSTILKGKILCQTPL